MIVVSSEIFENQQQKDQTNEEIKKSVPNVKKSQNYTAQILMDSKLKQFNIFTTKIKCVNVFNG